jgi:hypothetical protein
MDQFEGYYDVLLHRPSDPTGLNGYVYASIDMQAVRMLIETSTEFLANE